MNKIAIISALSGLNGEYIKDPVVKFDNVDYFLFTDREYSNFSVWKQKQLPKFSTVDLYSDRRNAKIAKVLGFLLCPGYDYYIWRDHTSEVIIDPYKMVELFFSNGAEIALFKHPERNCLYQELNAIVYHKKEIEETSKNTLEYFRRIDYPEGLGLFELSSFMYKNTPNIQNMMYTWWECICRYTSRDQCTFPYALNSHKISYTYIPGSAQIYGGNNNFIPQLRQK